MTANYLHNFAKLSNGPPLRVRHRVAEHVEEDRLREGVEEGEGGAAFGPQRLRPIQDIRNPPLLGQGRQGDLQTSKEMLWNTPLSGAPRHFSSSILSDASLSQNMEQIPCIRFSSTGSNDMKLR